MGDFIDMERALGRSERRGKIRNINHERRVRINAVGDVGLHGEIGEAIRRKGPTFPFIHCNELLRNADVRGKDARGRQPRCSPLHYRFPFVGRRRTSPPYY